MTLQQKKEIIEKRRQQGDSKEENIPVQYNNHQNNNQLQGAATTTNKEATDEVTSVITQSVAPTIRNIVASTQSQNTSSPHEWTIVMRKNSTLQSIRKNLRQLVYTSGMVNVLVDSGADTGKAFDKCWKFTS